MTRIDPPLFMGVETGYNDQGLAYSEETYSIREPNPNGFPIVYLARMALEEASTLEDVYRVIADHPVAAPGGTLWSDSTEGRGVRIEITPTAWADQPLDGAILWNFNDIVDPQLATQQHPRTNLAGFNRDRERIASAFPRQAEYALEDAVTFLRSRHAPAPDVPEYRLYAGLAAYQQGKVAAAIERLEGTDASHPGFGTGLSPEQELYRLTALERAWAARDPKRAVHYEAEREALLAAHGAASYYRTAILPRFNRLEKDSDP